MKTQTRNKQLFKLSGLLALALLALLMTYSAHAAAPIVPDGLTAAEWESIQAQIAAAEYQFAPVESGWVILNRAQGWQTTFSPARPQINPVAPWLQQAKLTASDAAAGDRFGWSVAVSGDTAIIGAYYDDTAVLESGSAYVFTRSGGVWTEQAKLTASDAGTGDFFGWSVAVSGDTAVIGAGNADDAGSSSGSAYVFTRSGGVWTEQAKLAASDAAAGDGFGVAVAVSGDTAVIGASSDDDDGAGSGSAYVFTRSGDVWTEQAKLTASDGAMDDRFGNSVAVSEDTVVIGVRYDDDAGTDSGSVYVFIRSGGIWTEQAKLTASDAAASDWFGCSVAVSGDTAVVGARYDDDVSINSGSAYVFARSSGVWTEQAKLTASDGTVGDFFGDSVAVSGDTAVIGANDDDAGPNSGSAYVFTRSGSVWTEQAKLIANDTAATDWFGCSVAVSGDTAVIGAVFDDDAGTTSGSAYAFTRCIASAGSGNWSSGATWVGGVAPTMTDGACVGNGHTVTLDGAAAADTLQVFSGGVLDLSTFNIIVENGVWNSGAIEQTQLVDGSGAVNFLQIRDSGDTVDQYRGLDFAAGANLGVTTVRVMGNTAVCNNNDGGAYRDRCFMANPTNAGTVNITLHSTPGEDDLMDDAFFQYAGSNTWTQGAACADGAGVGGACTGSATFASPAWFLIGSGGDAPTAVTLQTISASTNNHFIIVLAMILVGVGTAATALFIRRKQA